jgi:hypothetical protein
VRTITQLLAGVLALSAFAVAETPRCEILLPARTQAGATVLAPGQYVVEVDGSRAIFTNVITRHSFAAPVRVETTKLHEATAIQVGKQGDAHFLRSIDLAGSDETLEFE